MPSAVITGGNTGLGYAIAKKLLSEGFEVIIACRNTRKAAEAVDALIAEREVKKQHGDPTKEGVPVRYVRLDLEDEDSFGVAADEIAKFYPDGVDVIYHNAGIGADSDKDEKDQAEKTAAINYFATRKVARAFMSSVRNGGRIIFISSRAGMLQLIPEPLNREKFLADWVTPDDIDRLLREYIKACGAGKQEEEGWPKDAAYGMSKVALTAFVRCLAKEGDLYLKRGVVVHCYCPGWCFTDMTDEEAPRTADEGADTPAWLATAEEVANVTGRFYAERREIDWVNTPMEKAEEQSRKPLKDAMSAKAG